MEQSVMEQRDFLEKIREVFPEKEPDIRAYSPLALAFIGDGIYEAVVRTVVIRKANRSAAQLHRMTVNYVKAPAQAEMLEIIEPLLSEEEAAVLRRGKNASPRNSAKNASLSEYHRATGFEALMGYLYLMGRTDRMLELISAGMKSIEEK